MKKTLSILTLTIASFFVSCSPSEDVVEQERVIIYQWLFTESTMFKMYVAESNLEVLHTKQFANFEGREIFDLYRPIEGEVINRSDYSDVFVGYMTMSEFNNSQNK